MASSDFNPVGFLFNGAGDDEFTIASSGGEMSSFQVDAVLSETHNFTRQVTENPVENGSPIADHIIENPTTLEIKAIITDQPIKGLVDAYSEGFQRQLAGSRYTYDAFLALKYMHLNKIYLTVYTEYEHYENMVVEAISIPRQMEDGEALIFTISLKQVRVVSTATTTLPKGIGVKKDGKSNALGENKNRAQAAKDVGKNTGQEVSNGASVLKQAIEGGSDTISEALKSVKATLGITGL